MAKAAGNSDSLDLQSPRPPSTLQDLHASFRLVPGVDRGALECTNGAAQTFRFKELR
jgi:hypothetical protein